MVNKYLIISCTGEYYMVNNYCIITLCSYKYYMVNKYIITSCTGELLFNYFLYG